MNTVWLEQRPSWFPYIHGLVSAGIWNKVYLDETEGKVTFELDIVTSDRSSHPSLDNISVVTLEYKKGDK